MTLREQIGDAILRAGTDPNAMRASVVLVVANHVCIPDRDALARALHIVSGMPHPEGSVLSEFECYCRRIATVDTTPDGPIDPGWGEAEFDPAAWGETAQRPTGCERVADAIIAALEKP